VPGMSPRSRFLLLAITAVLFVTACSNPRTQPVLKVGKDITVLLAEYKSLAAKRFGSADIAETEPISSHEAYLDEILVRHLKVIDGRHRGYDQDPSVQVDYDQALERAAITKLYNDRILSSVIPEADIRNFYKSDTKEIHASHILISPENNRTEEEAKALIDSLHQLLQAGADFAELARSFTDDQSTPQGDIGWFRRGVMVSPFEEAAFSLKPGDISSPVRTSFGWHLIKLHETRPVQNRPEYLDDKERISQLLARQRSEQLVEVAADFLREMQAERRMKVDSAAVDKLMKSLQNRLATPDIVSMLSEKEQNQVVATLDAGGIEITIFDMKDHINRSIGRARQLTSSEQLIQIIHNFIAEKHLLPVAAKAAGSYQEEDVLAAARDAADRKIYQIVQQNLISNRIDPTDDEVRAYFEKNPDRYMQEAQFTLIECLVDNKELATQIFQRAHAGENLRELAMQYTKRITVKNANGVFGPIRRTQYGAIGRMASEAQIGELVGPVRIGSDWSVFRVISKEEPRLEDFEKVENRVRNDLRTEMRKNLESAWLDSLRKNISFSVNMKAIKRAYPNAKADS